MGEKDITQKKLEDFAEVFADIINVLLFGGERRVKPDQIVSSSTESAYKADGRIRSQKRDVAKYWEIDGVRIAMFGIENQTNAERYMPFRIISYDGAEYRKEISVIDSISRENTLARKNDPDAVLRSLPPAYPVISLVLYFGESRWEAPKTLKECMDYPDYLEPIIMDYPLNLFEITFLDDETVERFQSDFRFVAEYFTQVRKSKDGVIDAVNMAPEEIVHVGEVLELIEAMTGDKNFTEAYNMSVKGGPITMTTLSDIWIEKGISQGKYETIMMLLRAGDITDTRAAEILGMTPEEFQKEYEKWLAKQGEEA